MDAPQYTVCSPWPFRQFFPNQVSTEVLITPREADWRPGQVLTPVANLRI
jgi:hypothetical protein